MRNTAQRTVELTNRWSIPGSQRTAEIDPPRPVALSAVQGQVTGYSGHPGRRLRESFSADALVSGVPKTYAIGFSVIRHATSIVKFYSGTTFAYGRAPSSLRLTLPLIRLSKGVRKFRADRGEIMESAHRIGRRPDALTLARSTPRSRNLIRRRNKMPRWRKIQRLVPATL